MPDSSCSATRPTRRRYCTRPRRWPRSPVPAERAIAERLAAERDHLVSGLRDLLGKDALPGEPASSFVLVRVPDGARVRAALRHRGFAVRRGDTFPGLGPHWLRIAVRDT